MLVSFCNFSCLLFALFCFVVLVICARKSRSSRADGTGYGGDHELAGGNSVETGKAKEREAKHDEQCETMLMTVRQYLTE